MPFPFGPQTIGALITALAEGNTHSQQGIHDRSELIAVVRLEVISAERHEIFASVK